MIGVLVVSNDGYWSIQVGCNRPQVFGYGLDCIFISFLALMAVCSTLVALKATALGRVGIICDGSALSMLVLAVQKVSNALP